MLALSSVVLAGWLTGNPALTTFFDDFPSMKANTALSFLFLGTCLLTNLGSGKKIYCTVIGMVLIIESLATLGEYLWQIDLGIDQFLVSDPWSDSYPGRPSQGTAFTFFISGLLLLFGKELLNQRTRLFDSLLLIGAISPVVALFGYIYSPKGLFNVSPLSTMSVHTAFCFVVYFIGSSLVYRDSAISKLLINTTPGSRQFRRLLLPILVFPIVLGWLIKESVSKGRLDSLFGIALFAGIFCLSVLMALTWNARRENLWFRRLNAELEAKLEAQLQLSLVLDSAMGAILLFGEDGQLKSANRGACRIFGWSSQDLLHMKMDELIPPQLSQGEHQQFQQLGWELGPAGVNDNPQQMVGRTKDGTDVPLLVTVSKQQIDDETLYGAVMLKADGLANQMYRLTREMNIDSLTKIENRHSLDNTILQTKIHGLRHDQEMAILMLDIDYFKRINDSFGHEVGDVVLAEFAARVSTCLRFTDRFYRYGGEEFVVLAMDTNLDQARALAERIRVSIESESVQFNDRKIRLTCSSGIAILGKNKRDIEFCLRCADQALYRAKDLGRNQSVVYSREMAA